jgi:CRP-like cAMP-binding protein
MTDPQGRVNSQLLKAWESSYFASLPHTLRNAILRTAFTVSVPAGRPIYEANGAPRLALIHSGQASVKVVARSGRAATVRYAGPGQVIGLPSAITDGAPVGADAITDCEVSMLDTELVRRLAERNASLAWLLAQQASNIIYETIELLAGNLFGSMRQRVSRHLLDLASNSIEGLVVHAHQQDIADAIGSVREVVARTLCQLEDDGLIVRDSHKIRLVDPARLHAAADGTDADTGMVGARSAEA